MNSQDAGGMPLPILQGTDKLKDPVCGMMVVPQKAAAKVEHSGKTYYFCSTKCSERFSSAPEKFLCVSESVKTDHRGQRLASQEHGEMPQVAAAHAEDK